jgi:hypothetical protein
MSKGADVPKMTTEFVAGEILRHIREQSNRSANWRRGRESFRRIAN